MFFLKPGRNFENPEKIFQNQWQPCSFYVTYKLLFLNFPHETTQGSTRGTRASAACSEPAYTSPRTAASPTSTCTGSTAAPAAPSTRTAAATCARGKSYSAGSRSVRMFTVFSVKLLFFLFFEDAVATCFNQVDTAVLKKDSFLPIVNFK